ncbi:hypothetical protein IC229_20295 [Spirosoma sp. BT702]|uniref:Uncharacterized protein n=1 Tax=Spirosoma profusum TaxID=2771354 RepID=A0A926XY44_9BACT|nr:hypothetical protein [Spirosoma profusum]MBD2702998.1 hypothetical protein [Spirosoma profusum]
MKNEERILELIAETLRSIDRHSEQFERLEAEVKQINERLDRHQQQFDRQQEQLEYNQEQIDEKREQIWTVLRMMEKQQKRLDNHGIAIESLQERTEFIHQSSLEQVKAYRTMTELLMHQNQILRDKGIL